MIKVRGLGKQYGESWALKEIHFEVPPGSFLGVLGRNGAGKTTLVRLLTCQLGATEGRASILGFDVAARPLALRQRIGVMPEASALLEELTGLQYLHFVGRIHGIDSRTIEERIAELAELLEIDFRQPLRIAEYSYGMKKKVALASALLHTPELLFLDEPFEGLDPVSAAALQGMLASLHRKGASLLMTSHQLERAEGLCERFLIVDEGRLVADGRPGELFKAGESLEQCFLRTVGRGKGGVVSWM
jgi:ABC-2 type transport system ATP-binding protein